MSGTNDSSLPPIYRCVRRASRSQSISCGSLPRPRRKSSIKIRRSVQAAYRLLVRGPHLFDPAQAHAALLVNVKQQLLRFKHLVSTPAPTSNKLHFSQRFFYAVTEYQQKRTTGFYTSVNKRGLQEFTHEDHQSTSLIALL